MALLERPTLELSFGSGGSVKIVEATGASDPSGGRGQMSSAAQKNSFNRTRRAVFRRGMISFSCRLRSWNRDSIGMIGLFNLFSTRIIPGCCFLSIILLAVAFSRGYAARSEEAEALNVGKRLVYGTLVRLGNDDRS